MPWFSRLGLFSVRAMMVTSHVRIGFGIAEAQSFYNVVLMFFVLQYAVYWTSPNAALSQAATSGDFRRREPPCRTQCTLKLGTRHAGATISWARQSPLLGIISIPIGTLVGVEVSVLETADTSRQRRRGRDGNEGLGARWRQGNEAAARG